MKSPNRPPNGTNPRGKPKESNGATRKIPEKIDKKVKVNFQQDELTKLKKEYGKKIKIKTIKKIVWEIPEIKYFVTEFTVQQAYLRKKLIATAKNPKLPLKGILGVNLQSLIIELRHNFTGSCEKVSNFIEDLIGEKFSPPTIKDSIYRTAEQVEPDYKNLGTELRESKVAGSDETGWKVNGVNHQLWLMCAINIVFITIEKSRGREVLHKVFGTKFEGVVVSDCYAAYDVFAKRFQKCWAHLLRRTYYLTNLNPRKDIAKMHEQLSCLFNEAKKFLEKEPTRKKRLRKKKLLEEKLRRIECYSWKSDEARGIVKNWLRKFKGHWLTAIEIEGVELTNNKTERAIRKSIPTRKMLGGHRTERGAEVFAIVESLRLTWKEKGLSPFKMMGEKLREVNGKKAL